MILAEMIGIKTKLDIAAAQGQKSASINMEESLSGAQVVQSGNNKIHY